MLQLSLCLININPLLFTVIFKHSRILESFVFIAGRRGAILVILFARTSFFFSYYVDLSNALKAILLISNFAVEAKVSHEAAKFMNDVLSTTHEKLASFMKIALSRVAHCTTNELFHENLENCSRVIVLMSEVFQNKVTFNDRRSYNR